MLRRDSDPMALLPIIMIVACAAVAVFGLLGAVVSDIARSPVERICAQAHGDDDKAAAECVLAERAKLMNCRGEDGK